jgi:cytochrome b561
MKLINTKQNWGLISIGLHWITAVLIICLAVIGLWMIDLPNSPFKLKIYALHKSFGLTVLALTVLRLLWRQFNAAPDNIGNTPHFQAVAAKTVHILMYVLLFLIPLSGWLYNSASGFPLRWFNVISLPKLFTGYNPSIKHFAHQAHETFFYALASVLLIHAGAALWHHYVKHDTILKRMFGKTS